MVISARIVLNHDKLSTVDDFLTCGDTVSSVCYLAEKIKRWINVLVFCVPVAAGVALAVLYTAPCFAEVVRPDKLRTVDNGRTVEQNVPVIVGEFGATNRENTQDRTNQTAYYYAAARARGITCCLWDNSNASGDNEAYRFLDRTNMTFIYDSIADAAEKYGAPRTDFSGNDVDDVVSNDHCTIYPDGKVVFPNAVGKSAELYFDMDVTKSLCGGGALCFKATPHKARLTALH